MHHLFWALLALTIIAVLLRQDWIYFLVYVIGGVWALSHWWVRRSLRKLEVQRVLVQRAFAGEQIDVVLNFTNRSWLPIPWLQVREQVPLELKDRDTYSIVLSVGGRARTRHHYKLQAKQRGLYRLGPLVLKTGDLFGFSSATWNETSGVQVTVYPQVLPLHKLGLPSRSPFGTLKSRQRLFEDPTRMAGVRDYAVGDSMRRIHWKASAHEDGLLVKKFQPAIALNMTIVLDLDRSGYPVRGMVGFSEWAIVVAASVASYAIEQRQAVGLICNGLDPFADGVAGPIPPHQGQGHLMALLALLARIQTHEMDTPLAAWLPRRLNDLVWGTTVVLVVPKLDQETLWLLHQAYRRGSNILVLICAPQADWKTVQSQAARLGVTVHRIVWESELRQLEE